MLLRDWLTPDRALPAALLVLSAVAVPILVMSPSGFSRLHHLEAEQTRSDREVAQMTQQIEQLRAEVARAKSDPAAVERIARDELGLVRQTEIVFQFGH
jgi:cell division protein FtsB